MFNHYMAWDVRRDDLTKTQVPDIVKDYLV